MFGGREQESLFWAGKKMSNDQGINDPSPSEIQARIKEMDWLHRHGFCERCIAAVMRKGRPSMQVVVHLIKQGKTPQEIEELFKSEIARVRLK